VAYSFSLAAFTWYIIERKDKMETIVLTAVLAILEIAAIGGIVGLVGLEVLKGEAA
jgi:hypothetical protein